jgi:hypothetical protein
MSRYCPEAIDEGDLLQDCPEAIDEGDLLQDPQGDQCKGNALIEKTFIL